MPLGEAVLHAAWIKNRYPTVALGEKTPSEALTENRPDLTIAQELVKKFTYSKNYLNQRDNQEPKKAIFTGFDDRPEAIRNYEWSEYILNPAQVMRQDETKTTTLYTQDIPFVDGGIDRRTLPKKLRYQGKRIQNFQRIRDWNIETWKSIAPRILRSKIASKERTRQNYANLAAFKARKYIHQPAPGYNVDLNPNPKISIVYHTNSPQVANIAHTLITKNGNDELVDITIQKAREHMDCMDLERAIQVK